MKSKPWALGKCQCQQENNDTTKDLEVNVNKEFLKIILADQNPSKWRSWRLLCTPELNTYLHICELCRTRKVSRNDTSPSRRQIKGLSRRCQKAWSEAPVHVALTCITDWHMNGWPCIITVVLQSIRGQARFENTTKRSESDKNLSQYGSTLLKKVPRPRSSSYMSYVGGAQGKHPRHDERARLETRGLPPNHLFRIVSHAVIENRGQGHHGFSRPCVYSI